MRRLTKAMILSAMVAAALAATCQKNEPAAESADAEAGEWQIETVAADVGDSSAIAVDSKGRPHIAFKGNIDGFIGARGLTKYASRAGDGWESVTLDADPDHHGWYRSISVDDRDRIQVYYYGDNLRYARFTGGAWETATVDAPEGVRRYDGITFDSRGRPHICVFSGGELKYGRRTADGWELETVESGKWYPDSSLVLDRSGRPYIFYSQIPPRPEARDDERKLKYARWTGTEWDVRTVDALDGVNPDLPLAVDSRGRLHVVYQDPLRRDLKYAVWTDGRWRVETVDAKGLVGTGSAIALDAQDLPYISYYGDNGLKFAHYTGDGWYVQTLDTEAGKPSYGDWETSLVLDGRGRPHVSYFDRCKDELKYATWTGSEWKAQPAPGPGEGKDASAAGAVVRWYPGLSLLEPGRPWRPVVSLFNHGLLYDKPFTDDSGYEADEKRVLEIEADREGAAVVGRLEEPTEVEITAAKSVYTLLVRADEDPIGPRWGYYTWLKVRAKGEEGWAVLRGVHPDYIGPYDAPTPPLPDVYMYPDFPPLALVRFTERFSPLREGPSAAFPHVKGGFLSEEYAAAGEVDEVVAGFGDRICISPGWLRADTPGLAFYFMTFAWRPYRGVEEVHFYFPVEGDVDRIIYSIDLGDWRFKSPLPYEDPVMTVSAGGRAYDSAISYLRVNLDWAFDRRYFEAVLPEPLKREDIESVTFAVGTEPHRVKATFDPREAWAEYDEGR